MTKEARWRRVDHLFEAALELPPEHRAELLDRECHGDEEVRREVETLLDYDRGDSFLEAGASEDAVRLFAAQRGPDLVGPDLVGQRLGRFEVEARLGAGGMGVVYRGRDPLLGRAVALKLIAGPLRDDPDRVRRFRREALATSALNHPNIVTVYEILELDERDVLVTELVVGATLHQRMATGMTVTAALEVAIQIARGLAAAHAVGVVHRDVKPQNVMVREDGLVKVLDFGIAKSQAIAPNETDTGPGQVLGTVAYMSPEQARGLAVDARTDVWSLGVILYQMVTGEAPFRGSSPTDTLAAILLSDPEPPSRLREGLPPELDSVIARVLAKDRDQRYQSAAALAVDLELLMEARSSAPAARSAEPPSRPHRWGTADGRRAAVGSALAIATLAAALSGLWYFRASSSGAIDSLAVLPLLDTTSDPSTEYLSDGITESLIQSLAQVQDLKVMSRTASFRYKGRDIDPQAVGRELGVRSVLTGRTTSSADGLSLSLELIDARDGSHVWGGQYHAGTTELASLHERIARDLHRRLRRPFDSEAEARVDRLHSDDPDAYQLYLQGRFHWHRPRPEDYHLSRDFFLRAIETDPDYALAWSGLGSYYGRGASSGLLAPDEYWPRAEQALHRALELDPDLPESKPLVAAIALSWQRDWIAGERLMREAVEVFPEAVSHAFYFSSLTGRFDEALPTLLGSFDDDPNPVRASQRLADAYYLARRHLEAAEQARASVELDGTSARGWERLGDALHELGRHEEAVIAWRQVLDLEGLPELAAEVERTFAGAGLEASLHVMSLGRLERFRARLDRGDYVPAFVLARLYLRAGEPDSALDWAVKAFDERNLVSLEMLTDPVFDPLRAEPRFREGLRSLGLPADWTDAIARTIDG